VQLIAEPLSDFRRREARRALTTRYLDFWLLGGASIAVWLFMFALQPLRPFSWAIDHHYDNVFAISNTLALVVNYPHFMASYALAYRKGWGFIRAHWLQLVLVPVLLAIVVGWPYFLFESPTRANGVINASNAAFAKLGLRTRFGLSPSLGAEILGLATTTMFLTVGWHYTKQVYGSMMVYASFDSYPITPAQRRILKWNLFGIWWLSFTSYNVSTEPSDFFGLRYFRLGLPPVLATLSAVFLAVTLGAVLVTVFWRVYQQEKRLPGANMIVAYVAMYLWWVPMFVQNEFYMYVVPFFHSLQYLPFVYKIEQQRNGEIDPHRAGRRGTITIAVLVLAGFACFELAPNTADALLATNDRMSVWYFFIAAQIFINVHHYFIDNVLWRFDDPEIRKYLLA
jgi:hypothetical protein